MGQTLSEAATYPAALDLFLWPAGQDVTHPLTTGEVDTAITHLRSWIRLAGYTPLGPVLLSWNDRALRELRQPIFPAFAPQVPLPYRIVQRPELMVAEVPISFKDGTFNLAGVYDFANEYGLDSLGPPYIPLPAVGANIERGTTRGFLPVVPQGTTSLIPLSSWYSAKMGLRPQVPQHGAYLSQRIAWEHTGLILLRTLIGVVLLTIVLLPYIAFCGVVGGVIEAGPIQDIIVASIIPSLVLCAGLEVVLGSIMLATRLYAVKRWNAFWRRTPTPPTLLFDQLEQSW